MSFRVGQKVVCVDNSEKGYRRTGCIVHPGMDGLKKGCIYTVREIGLVSWVDGDACIRVEEIVRVPVDEPYWARRFRPVVERKTDISVFTRIYDQKPMLLEAAE